MAGPQVGLDEPRFEGLLAKQAPEKELRRRLFRRRLAGAACRRRRTRTSRPSRRLLRFGVRHRPVARRNPIDRWKDARFRPVINAPIERHQMFQVFRSGTGVRHEAGPGRCAFPSINFPRRFEFDNSRLQDLEKRSENSFIFPDFVYLGLPELDLARSGRPLPALSGR